MGRPVDEALTEACSRGDLTEATRLMLHEAADLLPTLKARRNMKFEDLDNTDRFACLLALFDGDAHRRVALAGDFGGEMGSYGTGLPQVLNSNSTTAVNRFGATLLHAAAASGNLPAVKALVAAGADVAAVKTPPAAADRGDLELRTDGVTALFIAARAGSLAVVRFLAEDAGAEVSVTMKGGATPLYIACQEGKLDVAQYLCGSNAADLNQEREDGKTCLFAAGKSYQPQSSNLRSLLS